VVKGCFVVLRGMPQSPIFVPMEEKKDQAFVNPIDKDKVAENPGLLPYAHTAGGAVIRPEDKGQIRGNAMTAMYDQTDRQMEQLRQQMETLALQAKSLHERKQISEMIYSADMHFQPVIHHIYHLYERKSTGLPVLSMVGPEEWGRKNPFDFIATVRLLGDHTWEVLSGRVSDH
jgi:Protein of unknown function (DUF2452)